MGYTLLCIAGLVAVIWFAAILLWFRDTYYGDPATLASNDSSTEPAYPELQSLGAPPLPLWRKVVGFPLALHVALPAIIVLIVLFAPLAIAGVGARGIGQASSLRKLYRVCKAGAVP
jgi:hypothetical protein